jgi:CubicO group peptidase (beta-lactamase class C family)
VKPRLSQQHQVNMGDVRSPCTMFDYIHGERFRSRALELMKRHRCPGIAIAVVEHGVSDSEAFGLAVTDPPTPCTANTIFDIASSSKVFTATAVALLVADPRSAGVQCDALMGDLLPGDFELSDPERTRSTRLDDLVGHTTGVPGYGDSSQHHNLLT